MPGIGYATAAGIRTLNAPTKSAPGMRLTEAARELRCMEIWGGNSDIEERLQLPGIDAWVCATAHGDTRSGGDVHYVSTCGSGSIVRFAVADVAGHGEAVADLGARLRALMRKYINTLDQSRFARELNGELAGTARGGRFATALLTTLHVHSRRLLVCNAGHPRPLRYRHASARWELLDILADEDPAAAGNLPLGVAAPTPYAQTALDLEAGDLLVLYTDALIDTPAADGARLGEHGLLRLATGLPRGDAVMTGRALVAAVDALRGLEPLADDRTVVVLQLLEQLPPPPDWRERVLVMAKMLGVVRV